MIISQKKTYSTAHRLIKIMKKKLLALLALQVRRKKAFQKAARAGQSRSEIRPAVTETTCAQWRAGCFNLVVGMGEASDRRGSSLNGRQFETEGEVGPSSVKDKR